MVNLDEMFSGNYITAEKIKNNLKLLEPMIVIGVKAESVKDDEKPKPMLQFDGIEETLLLNKTNYLFIKEAHQLKPNQKLTDQMLIGGTIKLKLDKEMYNGKMVDAVRVGSFTPREKTTA